MLFQALHTLILDYSGNNNIILLGEVLVPFTFYIVMNMNLYWLPSDLFFIWVRVRFSFLAFRWSNLYFPIFLINLLALNYFLCSYCKRINIIQHYYKRWLVPFSKISGDVCILFTHSPLHCHLHIICTPPHNTVLYSQHLLTFPYISPLYCSLFPPTFPCFHLESFSVNLKDWAQCSSADPLVMSVCDQFCHCSFENICTSFLKGAPTG